MERLFLLTRRDDKRQTFSLDITNGQFGQCFVLVSVVFDLSRVSLPGIDVGLVGVRNDLELPVLTLDMNLNLEL